MGRADLGIADRTDAIPSDSWAQIVVDHMPQLVWRAVGLGSWTWSSAQWTDYTGQSLSEAAGLGWLAVIHPDDREIAAEAWRKAPDLDEFQADMRIQGRDGQVRWFQTRGKPVRDERGAVIEWIGTSTDIDDLRRLQSEQKVLVSELQHRSRNLIAVVHSICVQTLQSAATLDDFRDRFEDRLAALARVQGLLSTPDHGPIALEQLVRMEVDALAGERGGSQVTVEGPNILVRHATAQTLALAIHELATNALKYGALSAPTGRLSVTWREHVEDGEPWLRLEWREQGLLPSRAAATDRRGYGRELIEHAVPRQLGARSEMRFGSDVMDCILDFPLKRISPHAPRG